MQGEVTRGDPKSYEEVTAVFGRFFVGYRYIQRLFSFAWIRSATSAGVLLSASIACSLAWGGDENKAGKKAEEKPLPVPDMLFLCKDTVGEIFTNTRLNKSCKSIRLGSVLAKPVTVNPAAPATAAVGATPVGGGAANFPRVSGAAQQARDVDRKRILEDELIAEQKSLDAARKELAAEESKAVGEEKNYKKLLDRLQPLKDKVGQHDRNIQALRKELARVK